MESIPSGCQNRTQIQEAIAAGTSRLIDGVAAYRKTFKRGDKNGLLFDLGDTLAKTIKLFSLTNRDFGERLKGISESGIPWLIRALSRMLTELLQTATVEQLRNGADLLRNVADTLSAVVEEEEGNRGRHLRLVQTEKGEPESEGAKPHEVSH